MSTKPVQPAEGEVQYPEVQPGDICPCCGRKVPANAKAPMTEDEKRAKRRAYNSTPEAKARQKEYRLRKAAELAAMRERLAELESEGADGDA